tara:strand:- start:818 stop:1339 length:522 start_codon:yes stop_codon:yes gene_type:complete
MPDSASIKESIGAEFMEMENNEMISVPEYFGLICGENETTVANPGGAATGIWNEETMGTRSNSPYSEKACNDACSQDPSCNFASHQIICVDTENDGENVDDCKTICLHSSTCNNPIRMTHENTTIKSSEYYRNPLKPRPITAVQTINWTFIGLFCILLFYIGYKYLYKKQKLM